MLLWFKTEGTFLRPSYRSLCSCICLFTEKSGFDPWPIYQKSSKTAGLKWIQIMSYKLFKQHDNSSSSLSFRLRTFESPLKSNHFRLKHVTTTSLGRYGMQLHVFLPCLCCRLGSAAQSSAKGALAQLRPPFEVVGFHMEELRSIQFIFGVNKSWKEGNKRRMKGSQCSILTAQNPVNVKWGRSF